MFRVVTGFLILILAGCGGGGESGGGTNGGGGSGGGGGGGGIDERSVGPIGCTTSTPPDSVRIRQVTAELAFVEEVDWYIYETDSPAVMLAGYVSDRTGTVTVANSSTGDEQEASVWWDPGTFCSTGMWDAGPMDLVLGNNTFTIDDGNDNDIVMIRRIVDNVAPTVASVMPTDGSSDNRLNIYVRATFDDFMDASTIDATTFLVFDGQGNQVPGVVSYDATTRTARFSGDLQVASTYTARITASVADDGGNFLAQDYEWSFTMAGTGTAVTRTLARPTDGAVCVAPDSQIAARFDKPLSPATLNSTTVVVEDEAGVPVSGTIDFNTLTLTFSPDTNLSQGETYTIHLNDGIADNEGLPLAPQSWEFSTAYTPEGTWAPIASIPFGARDKHSAVWTGAEVVVFGGQAGGPYPADRHGAYDPATDQWRELSSIDAPLASWNHTSTWTGSEVIIWGGRDWDHVLSGGGIYDPALDTWRPISDMNAPSARYDHSAVWTGNRLIVWGGRRVGQDYGDGGIYDPATDTWTPMSDVNAPSPRNQHHAFWDGRYMIIWGGREGTASNWMKDGAMYDPMNDVWLALPSQGAPDPSRVGYLATSAVWTGVEMLVWSYFSEYVTDEWTGDLVESHTNEGRRFSDATGWESVADGCGTETVPVEAWMPGRMFSWNSDLSEGYFYDQLRDGWIPLADFIGPAITGAAVVSTDDAVFVIGGVGGLASPGVKSEGYRLTLP